MPDDYEPWEDSEDLDDLTEMLSTYNVGASADYDTLEDLHDDLAEMGGPETWDNVELVFDQDGTCYLDVTIDGEVERFVVGGQDEFDAIYDYLDDMDVDFDVGYEEGQTS